MTSEVPWIIVGRGRVGGTLARVAERLGIEVRASYRRADGPPDALPVAGAAVFLTVTDDAIAEVARQLAPLEDAALVVHCSGSLSSDVLQKAGITAAVGSVHPLLAIADPAQAVDKLASAAWTVEGDAPVIEWARGWLSRLGIEPTTIDGRGKVLYHAAAVTSAGLVVALLDAAFDMARHAGIDRARAAEMLVPLARSALANLDHKSPAEALTGPVARGDEGVIAAHLAALEALGDDELVAVYSALTARARSLRRA